MNKVFILGAISVLLGMGVLGCSNTAEGVKADATSAGEVTSKAAENAASATQNAAKNTTAALEVTPSVKTAITADSQLNDPKNLINVDSKDGTVHLKGHVVSEDVKKHAGDVAQQKLTQMNATDKLSNELTVDKP